MAKFRRLVLLSLSLGLALAGGCRSPDALAATPTDTSVTLTDWQAGTDLTNFQHPRPYQYLAVPNIIATANQQASTQTPSSAAIRPDQSVLPQTNEARQLLVWLGLLTAVLAGWLVWLMQRRRSEQFATTTKINNGLARVTRSLNESTRCQRRCHLCDSDHHDHTNQIRGTTHGISDWATFYTSVGRTRFPGTPSHGRYS